MLEDDFNDVLGKAIRGLDFDTNSLNLDADRLQRCLNGELDAEVIQVLAPALNLNPERLLNLPNYEPEVSIPEQVKTFVSAFGHLGVNAFTVENETHILIFDTGTNAQECIESISKYPEKEKHLFITHRHPDHIAWEEELRPYVNTSHLLMPGTNVVFGNLTLKTLDVAGHMIPASAYFITGLASPICITGDAIFAGSAGGVCHENYHRAHTNIRENLLTLPPETILLTGHGPATSVRLELQNNPFL